MIFLAPIVHSEKLRPEFEANPWIVDFARVQISPSTKNCSLNRCWRRTQSNINWANMHGSAADPVRSRLCFFLLYCLIYDNQGDSRDEICAIASGVWYHKSLGGFNADPIQWVPASNRKDTYSFIPLRIQDEVGVSQMDRMNLTTS